MISYGPQSQSGGVRTSYLLVPGTHMRTRVVKDLGRTGSQLFDKQIVSFSMTEA